MNNQPKKIKIPGTKPSHQRAMVRSLVLELVRAEKLQTTPSRAKALKQVFDRVVTEAKKDTPASRRRVANMLRNDKAETKLYSKLLPRLQDSNSGYTNSARTLPRKGDGAEQIIVMVKGTELRAKKSRLQAALAKRNPEQEEQKQQTKRTPKVQRKQAAPQGSAKKHDSTADTRRVST